MVMVILERDAPSLSTTARKRDVEYLASFVHLNDGPQRRQQQVWVLRTKVFVRHNLQRGNKKV
jgi:hypothetical protein